MSLTPPQPLELVDSEVVLPGNEGEPVAELEEECLQPLDQGGLQVPLGGRAGELQEVQDARVTGQLLRQLGMASSIGRCNAPS